MTLNDKVAYTREFIARVMENYKAPAFLCSFGKDSMVLLHIMRGMGVNVPLVFYRDPWFAKKYVFAQRVAAEWDLVVHDYNPSRVTMSEGREIMAFTNPYQIGGAQLARPKNILEPVAGERFVCGLTDVLHRPTGSYNFNWDAVFIGHKSSDQDQIAGKIPLHADVRSGAGIFPDAVFPLRHWTDADVWSYSKTHNVPQQEDRYDVENECELPDKSANSDYARVCIECVDCRKRGQVVHCPKLDMDVTNVSERVVYEGLTSDYFGNANNQS